MRSADHPALRFRNALNLIKSIDRHELEEARIIPATSDGSLAWAIFREDPIDFIQKLDNQRLARLWALMESRWVSPSPVPHVEALEAIRRLSSLDDEIGGASAIVMSRMAEIHQHADAALAHAPPSREVGGNGPV